MSESTFSVGFYLLCAVLLWFTIRGIRSRHKIFEYPTLAAVMGLAWVVPQGIELESDLANAYASSAFWLYVTGCFIFILWGFEFGRKNQHKRIARNPEQGFPILNVKRLLYIAAGLVAVGQLATFRMQAIDTSGMGGQWTGVVTMWYLLASANGFGLCLAVLILARNRSLTALALASIAVIPIAGAALGGVRREQLFDLIVLTAGVWYFAKGKYPPRTIVITGVLIGTVILNSAGDLRSQVRSGDQSLLGALFSGDIIRNFEYFNFDQGTASEVALAQFDYWYINQTWQFEFGAEHWNMIVHQYVPSFIVGRSVKDALKFPTLSERIRRDDSVVISSLGSTRTGFSDSYRAFGVFGVLIFWAIGCGFGVLYAIAELRSVAWQFLYFTLLAEGLKAITHSTGELLRALPFTIAIFMIVISYARVSEQARGDVRG